MTTDELMIQELLKGAAWGFFPLAAWRLASSLWGWYRGENYYYDASRKNIFWDRARFRHALGAVTVCIAALLGYVGWRYLFGDRLIGYAAGLLLIFFFPLPAQGPVLLFKLWRIDPPTPRGGDARMTRPSGRQGRDP
uniref:hypothetical protein n=1 Tax=unclassified Variovorax TaxID=663243 RepID=UPI001050DCFD